MRSRKLPKSRTDPFSFSFSFLAFFLLIFTLCSCQVSRPGGANLSTLEAIDIAKTVAIENNERLETYKAPDATFDLERHRWLISFSKKRPYTYGQPDTYHYFGVDVDDKTKRATYHPFTFK